MPRDIPVSNGKILICFDSNYQIRDVYFPHVGLENHSIGYPFRFGVWADGYFSWISDPTWQRILKYKTDTLVTDVWLRNDTLGIELICNDFVDVYQNHYVRQIKVKNLWERSRDVRVFFHHDFRIYGSEVGDTAFYHPLWKSVIHYKNKRYFACGLTDGVEHYSIGAKAMGYALGTWKDAEDGDLQNTVITHGSVDSTIGKYLKLSAFGESVFNYWISFGTDMTSVERLHFNIHASNINSKMKQTEEYWRLWVNKENFDLTPLPIWGQDLFKRSLLIIRTQVDHEGAILAANDSDVQFVFKDHYSYVWPRDGAIVAQALDQARYEVITQKFYSLMNKIIDSHGFLLHKYSPEGTLASSWHPWVRDGEPQLPIQEDETALVIWALWEHFRLHKNVEFVINLYHSLIKPAANFMVHYRNLKTKLPLPSFDLWEERRGVLTFTCCTVEAGLRAAANFAAAFGDTAHYDEYMNASKEVKEAIKTYLYDEESGRFLRGLIHPNDHSFELIPDSTVDASLYGLFRFGTFSVKDPMVRSTMQAYREFLTVKTNIGGIARYQYDWYQASSPPTKDVPGNPWVISTLWLMIEEIMLAETEEELEESLKHLKWVNDHSLISGVLAEQVNPYDGKPLSVSPLTWSHATVVEVVMMYLRKLRDLRAKQNKVYRLHMLEGLE